MQAVRPKKALGQHFLTDQGIAQAIVAALRRRGPVLEVGPGTGVLTQYLLRDPAIHLKVVEIDTESVHYLLEHFPKLAPDLYEADFLKMDLTRLFAGAGNGPGGQPGDGSFALIGNFPYNISQKQLLLGQSFHQESLSLQFCVRFLHPHRNQISQQGSYL